MKKSLRILSFIASCLLLLSFPCFGNTSLLIKKEATVNVFSLDETLLKERFQQMDCVITPIWHPTTKSYIQSYVLNGRIGTEYLVGRTPHYFPVFEHYLKLYGLPDELKYLPVWESRLQPRAKSPVGAGGLWQLMPGTARNLGLVVNNTIDERFDVYKSTEAGVKYLAELYEMFGDWTIAIAAYNCGPGRMRKALKTSGHHDFWKSRRYLPMETRDYVPAILATVYLMKNYSFHDIRPRYSDYNFQMVRTTKVYEPVSLRRISKMTGVSMKDMQLLNPSYLQNTIPGSQEGNYLVLPERAASIFRNLYQSKRVKRKRTSAPPAQNTDIKTGYKILCFVKPGDSLDYIAKLYRCSKEEIMAWNDLENEELYVRQEIVIHILVKNKSSREEVDRS